MNGLSSAPRPAGANSFGQNIGNATVTNTNGLGTPTHRPLGNRVSPAFNKTNNGRANMVGLPTRLTSPLFTLRPFPTKSPLSTKNNNNNPFTQPNDSPQIRPANVQLTYPITSSPSINPSPPTLTKKAVEPSVESSERHEPAKKEFQDLQASLKRAQDEQAKKTKIIVPASAPQVRAPPAETKNNYNNRSNSNDNEYDGNNDSYRKDVNNRHDGNDANNTNSANDANDANGANGEQVNGRKTEQKEYPRQQYVRNKTTTQQKQQQQQQTKPSLQKRQSCEQERDEEDADEDYTNNIYDHKNDWDEEIQETPRIKLHRELDDILEGLVLDGFKLPEGFKIHKANIAQKRYLINKGRHWLKLNTFTNTTSRGINAAAQLVTLFSTHMNGELKEYKPKIDPAKLRRIYHKLGSATLTDPVVDVAMDLVCPWIQDQVEGTIQQVVSVANRQLMAAQPAKAFQPPTVGPNFRPINSNNNLDNKTKAASTGTFQPVRPPASFVPNRPASRFVPSPLPASAPSFYEPPTVQPQLPPQPQPQPQGYQQPYPMPSRAPHLDHLPHFDPMAPPRVLPPPVGYRATASPIALVR